MNNTAYRKEANVEFYKGTTVKDWIHDMYDKRQRKSKRKAVQQNKDNNHSI